MPEQRNLLLTIRYQGTNYHGFQVQKNAVTVAQVLQDALESVLGAREDIKGCSRTDSGVHANMFCVSVKTNSKIPCQSLIRALNVKLPYDIAVTDCREVPLDFHARYDCKGKRYLYQINNSEIKNPFAYRLQYDYRYPIDVEIFYWYSRLFLFLCSKQLGGRSCADHHKLRHDPKRGFGDLLCGRRRLFI